MNTRHVIRGILILAVVASMGLLVNGWHESELNLASEANAQSAQPFEDRSSVVGPRNNTTVITTDPPGRSNETAEIIALASDGRVLYYNNTYRNYFDVDPSPAGSQTVLYSAGTRYEPCPRTFEVKAQSEIDDRCALVVVERVNLTTGNVTRIHTEITEWGIWHDVDRLNETHLVVGDIERDRVLILNTTEGTSEWVWKAKHEFDPSVGGFADDWTHINDVEVLEDGRIMASLRNMDQVIFLDRETGMLGSPTLGADDTYDILYEQHNPDYIPEERGGRAIVVSDSENNRIVEYQRTNDSWQQSWQWEDDRLRWPRDADRLPNGHTLITDSQGDRVLEVNHHGAIVWSVTVGTPYEAERLETGDESTTGESAQELELVSTGGYEPRLSDEPRTRAGPIEKAIAFLRGPGVNGILYVAPEWMTIRELPTLGRLIGSILLWGALEMYWSSFGWASLRVYR